jgi:hypothetical protein
LVTTGAATDPNPAVFHAQGTSVLFGQSSLDYSPGSGMTIRIGTWCDLGQTLGFEVGTFFLEERSVKFQAGSDTGGTPILGVPFQDAQTSQELVDFVSFPGRFAGTVMVLSQSELWGIEGTLVGNLLKETIRLGAQPGAFGDLRIDWLAGFRYLDLHENINVDQVSTVLSGGQTLFNGVVVVAPSTLVIADGFDARSQFFGGQAGFRAELAHDRCVLGFSAKIGVGDTHQAVTINGNSTLQLNMATATFPPQLVPAASPVRVPGGLLATSTNIGRTERDRFGVVPEIGLTFAYQLMPGLRLFMGYNLLYWTNVVRPGDTIDRIVNTTQVPTIGAPGALNGPARPMPLLKESDFWAQGASFGLEVRF